MTVAFWTIVSRVSGACRAITVAAVLGPTYLGNTFQTLNTIPNLAYDLFCGSLFAALLVPALVAHVDSQDSKQAERIVGGFLGVVMLAFAGFSLLIVFLGPLVLRLFTLSVQDGAVADAQIRIGWPLLALLMPQAVLYAVAGVGAAVMNAHGRFGLAAAASTVENIGVIATLLAVAVLFGSGLDLETIQPAAIVVLGLGTTSAVGLHAAAQWWGSRRLGVRLMPRFGWRDEEVKRILRRALPALGHAWLEVLVYVAILVAANAVAGGVVAFLLALNFYYLPIAVGAQPIAVALRPQLSRLHLEGKAQAFKNELVRGAGLTFFLTVPASVAFLTLAEPLARAVAVGAMSTSVGVGLVVVSIRALAVGVVADSAFKLATDASYARGDSQVPLRAMLARTAVGMGIIAAVLTVFEGHFVLIGLGIAISTGALVGALHLARRLQMALPSAGVRLSPSLLRSVAASMAMIGPAYLVAVHPPPIPGGDAREVAGLLFAALLGFLMFVVTQRSWRSPELAYFVAGFRRSK